MYVKDAYSSQQISFYTLTIITMEEIRKEIPRLPNGKYYVSNLGRVKSKRWIMKFESNRYWHQRIKLYGSGGKKDVRHYQVHRLVYCVFNWLDYWEWLSSEMSKSTNLVLHRDNNPLNNRLDNLHLWTQSDNMKQCSRDGRNRFPAENGSYEQKKMSKMMAKVVKIYLKYWTPGAEIAERLWLKRTTVYNIKVKHTRKNLKV